jgi:rieske iron-sulfur protein
MGHGGETERKEPACGACVGQDRRRAVGLLAATGLAAVLPGRDAAAGEAAPAKSPPKPGDELVFAKGDRKGQAITTADLAADGTLIEAWPKDPASGTVRSGSRLNRVVVLRIDPAGIDQRTAARAAPDGILAYSAFCTHAGCFIENYRQEEKAIFCHCHNSMFDPRANGRVTGGPAKAPLAGLPVKVEGDKVLVAGGFQGKLGVPKA